MLTESQIEDICDSPPPDGYDLAEIISMIHRLALVLESSCAPGSRLAGDLGSIQSRCVQLLDRHDFPMEALDA